MAYFPDLSTYVYFPDSWRDMTLNVGWLTVRRPFPKARPSAELLDRLWLFCRWSIVQTRGCHMCEMCARRKQIPFGTTNMTHKGVMLSLGSAEIRVFGLGNNIYAAPTLIFHYIKKHHYNPPAEFTEAVLCGPYPPDPNYFKRLQTLDFEWRETSMPKDREGWLRRFKERIAQPDHPGRHPL